MVIGIISVQKTKNVFSRTKTADCFGEEPHFLVVEMPVFKNKIKPGSLKRAVKVLERSNSEKILFTQECKDAMIYSGLGDMYAESKPQHIPSAFIGNALWFVMDKFKKDGHFRGFKHAEIFDEGLDVVSYDFLAGICGCVKHITVTTSAEKINRVVYRMFADYGVCVDIKSRREAVQSKSDTIIADIDCGKIIAGDFVLDGAEVDIDTNGYNISNEDLLEMINGFKNPDFIVKNWLSGKNRIKIC